MCPLVRNWCNLIQKGHMCYDGMGYKILIYITDGSEKYCYHGYIYGNKLLESIRNLICNITGLYFSDYDCLVLTMKQAWHDVPMGNHAPPVFRLPSLRPDHFSSPQTNRQPCVSGDRNHPLHNTSRMIFWTKLIGDLSIKIVSPYRNGSKNAAYKSDYITISGGKHRLPVSFHARASIRNSLDPLFPGRRRRISLQRQPRESSGHFCSGR